MNNLAASVRQRLLNLSREQQRPFQQVLQFFVMERFLYRLSQSEHADRFILKGALMLQVWDAPQSRPTMDIDMLGQISSDPEALIARIRDVLAYIAFNLTPVSRAERVESRRDRIYRDYDYRQQEFLEFVLDHYVERGVGELDTEKLPQLIELKYHSVNDAVAELGSPDNIREVFVGFQKNLYCQ